jgi:hypothetical protein
MLQKVSCTEAQPVASITGNSPLYLKILGPFGDRNMLLSP